MVKSLGNSYFVHKTTLFCRSFQTSTLNRWSAAEETVGLRTKYHIANTNKASIEMDCGQIRTDFLVLYAFPFLFLLILASIILLTMITFFSKKDNIIKTDLMRNKNNVCWLLMLEKFETQQQFFSPDNPIESI